MELVSATSKQINASRALGLVSVDSRISARRNIGSRLASAKSEAAKLQRELSELQSFINQSANRYSTAEDKINAMANRIGTGYFPFAALASISGALFGFNGLKAKTDNGKEVYTTRDYAKENSWETLKAILGGFSLLNDRNLLRIAKNLRFKFETVNGKQHIKIVNGNLTNRNYNQYRDTLVRKLGGTNSDWKKGYLKRLMGTDGIPLYNPQNSDWFKTNRNQFKNTAIPELNQYVKQLDKSPLRNMFSNSGRAGLDELKIWEDFTSWKGWKEASNLSRAGQIAGIFGTVNTVRENFISNTTTGKTNWQDFTVDTAVDVGTGAAATAAGAAFGSLFLPPAGTIVGAAAGATINLVINWKFEPDKESIVDKTKTFFNDVVDDPKKMLKSTGDAIKGVGEKLNKIFW